MSAEQQNARHWRRTLTLSGLLLTVWLLASFVLPYFARELDSPFFGWPLGFWWVGQGALLLYLAIVIVYVRRMEQLDAQLLDEQLASASPQAEPRA